MQKWMLALFISLTQFVQAEPIAKIAVGTTHYSSEVQIDVGDFSQNGKTISIFLPLSVPFFEPHLKLGAAKHDIIDDRLSPLVDTAEPIIWHGMYNFVNEILVGKSLNLCNSLTIIPQFGFGAQGELYSSSIYKEAHVDIFIDAALEISYEFPLLTTGLMFNVEKDFGWSVRESDGVRIRSQLIFGL